MHKEAREQLRVRLKLVVLEHANHFGVTKACREFNVPRSTFYRWKQKYDKRRTIWFVWKRVRRT